MKRIQIAIKGIGKVLLALLTGVFMPLLVWVGLGVAINQKVIKKATQPKRLLDTYENLLENNIPVNNKKH